MIPKSQDAKQLGHLRVLPFPRPVVMLWEACVLISLDLITNNTPGAWVGASHDHVEVFLGESTFQSKSMSGIEKGEEMQHTSHSIQVWCVVWWVSDNLGSAHSLRQHMVLCLVHHLNNTCKRPPHTVMNLVTVVQSEKLMASGFLTSLRVSVPIR